MWHIPLNGSASKISKTDRYLKNGEVVEAARRDGRPGLLRSQLTFTPEGHVHIRCALPPLKSGDRLELEGPCWVERWGHLQSLTLMPRLDTQRLDVQRTVPAVT